MALSFDRNGSTLDLLLSLVYIVPLFWLVRIYAPRKTEIVPDSFPFLRQWETEPREAARKVAYGLGEALDKPKTGLSSAIEDKSRRLSRSLWWLFGVTVAVLLLRSIEAFPPSYISMPQALRMLTTPRVLTSTDRPAVHPAIITLPSGAPHK